MNSVDAAQVLVRGGADVEAVDATGRTALHFAASHGFDDFAEFLIAHGADAATEDEDSTTAAALARTAGHTALAAKLERQANR
jgi:ankyrin repeat protein